MPKIYTKRGDQGMTDVYRGQRRSKANSLYELLGKLDGVSVELGRCALLPSLPEKHAEFCRVLQQEIIGLSADIQSSNESVSGGSVRVMEALIDELTAELPPLTRFLLTVASVDDYVLQTARVKVRETERTAISHFLGGITGSPRRRMHHKFAGPAAIPTVKFLNRLSDYLYTLARWVVMNSGATEIVSDPSRIAEFVATYSA